MDVALRHALWGPAFDVIAMHKLSPNATQVYLRRMVGTLRERGMLEFIVARIVSGELATELSEEFFGYLHEVKAYKTLYAVQMAIGAWSSAAAVAWYLYTESIEEQVRFGKRQDSRKGASQGYGLEEVFVYPRSLTVGTVAPTAGLSKEESAKENVEMRRNAIVAENVASNSDLVDVLRDAHAAQR